MGWSGVSTTTDWPRSSLSKPSTLSLTYSPSTITCRSVHSSGPVVFRVRSRRKRGRTRGQRRTDPSGSKGSGAGGREYLERDQGTERKTGSPHPRRFEGEEGPYSRGLKLLVCDRHDAPAYHAMDYASALHSVRVGAGRIRRRRQSRKETHQEPKGRKRPDVSG